MVFKVNYVVEQISKRVLDRFTSKERDRNKIGPMQVRNHVFLFLNCLIENPSFDSQTKETLTTRPTHFGSGCTLTASFFKSLNSIPLVERIAESIQSRVSLNLPFSPSHIL